MIVVRKFDFPERYTRRSTRLFSTFFVGLCASAYVTCLGFPPRGVRIAIDEGLFLRFVRHNPPPHSPLGSLRSAVSRRGHLAGAGMLRAVSTAEDFSVESRRGHLAGAGMFRAVSTAGDFSTNARNDIAFVCFYTAGDLRPMFNTAERKKSYVFSARRFLMKCAKTVRRKTKTVLRVRRGFTIGRVFNAVRKKRPPKGS